MKKLDKVLIILGSFLAAFIICMIVIFCVFQNTPDTLITGVLGGGVLEAIVCGAIKCTNTIKENANEEDEELG